MKIELNTWQRINLLSLIGGIEGNVLTMYRLSGWLKALDLSKEESEAIGLVESGGRIAWSDDAKTWDITVPDDPKALSMVKAKFEAQQWNGINARNIDSLLGLADALGVKMEE